MLKAMFKKIGKSKKGFTLIELLVVIAILGVLAAILVPVVGGFINNAKQSAADSDAHVAYTAATALIAAGTVSSTSSQSNAYSTSSGTFNDTNLAPYLGPASNWKFSNLTIVTDSKGNVISTQVTANGATGTYPTTSH